MASEGRAAPAMAGERDYRPSASNHLRSRQRGFRPLRISSQLPPVRGKDQQAEISSSRRQLLGAVDVIPAAQDRERIRSSPSYGVLGYPRQKIQGDPWSKSH
jgi:hypothetical protein